MKIFRKESGTWSGLNFTATTKWTTVCGRVFLQTKATAGISVYEVTKDATTYIERPLLGKSGSETWQELDHAILQYELIA